MNGIDVSHHQGQIDWRKVHQSGIKFAFIKTTEGLTLKDSMFHTNWSGARAQKLLCGAYHFFRPQFDPESQAQHFLDVLDFDHGELPPTLDVEVNAEVSPDDLIARAQRWLEVVETELGCQAILYTGSSFWRTTLKNSNVFAEHPLWIAHYTSAPNPIVPSAWPRWTFWQYSQTGKVEGIAGNVDLNKFNGTMAELEALDL